MSVAVLWPLSVQIEFEDAGKEIGKLTVEP